MDYKCHIFVSQAVKSKESGVSWSIFTAVCPRVGYLDPFVSTFMLPRGFYYLLDCAVHSFSHGDEHLIIKAMLGFFGAISGASSLSVTAQRKATF